jgi:hypothetical protein
MSLGEGSGVTLRQRSLEGIFLFLYRGFRSEETRASYIKLWAALVSFKSQHLMEVFSVML